jgi:hypothetical protein
MVSFGLKGLGFCRVLSVSLCCMPFAFIHGLIICEAAVYECAGKWKKTFSGVFRCVSNKRRRWQKYHTDISSYLNSYSKKWFSNSEDEKELLNKNICKIYIYK